jgi:hypothetical protein
MLDINAIEPAGQASMPAPAPEQTLAKAHPAAQLLRAPGWACAVCQHKNPVTAPFCEKCPE